MTTKANKTSPLTQALLETANDMHGIGLLGNDAYEKITMRHLGIKKPEIEPLSSEDIRKIREQTHMSQSVFAHCLNVTVGYISQLERGAKRPTGAALMLLNVIHRKGIEAILWRSDLPAFMPFPASSLIWWSGYAKALLEATPTHQLVNNGNTRKKNPAILARQARLEEKSLALSKEIGRTWLFPIENMEWGVDLSSAAGKMTMQVIAAVAEFERDLLIERTQSGIIWARAAGKRFGRPPTLNDTGGTGNNCDYCNSLK